MSAKPIPTASLFDNLIFNLGYIIPQALQGLFTRRPFWVNLFSRTHPDPHMRRFGDYLRSHYHSDYIYVRMLTSKSLLVLDARGARRILARSPHIYGPGATKVRGMSLFQPHAVTISTGNAWRTRRDFNDSVLDFTEHADHFAAIISAEVKATAKGSSGSLRWPQIDLLLKRITVKLVCGEHYPHDRLLDTLRRMMQQSNRVIAWRRVPEYPGFDQAIRHALDKPLPDSLIARCPQAAGPQTRAQNQVPHWLFAMRETVAENSARCLISVLSEPALLAAVNASVSHHKTLDGATIRSLHLLENCLQEAMRLWPTTPLLSRETQVPDMLSHELVMDGMQVVIANNFIHRDTKASADAEYFRPQRWQSKRSDYRYNHLSNGPQCCAGKALALFVGTAVVAELLRGGFTQLESPPALRDGIAMAHCNVYRMQVGQKS